MQPAADQPRADHEISTRLFQDQKIINISLGLKACFFSFRPAQRFPMFFCFFERRSKTSIEPVEFQQAHFQQKVVFTENTLFQ